MFEESRNYTITTEDLRSQRCKTQHTPLTVVGTIKGSELLSTSSHKVERYTQNTPALTYRACLLSSLVQRVTNISSWEEAFLFSGLRGAFAISGMEFIGGGLPCAAAKNRGPFPPGTSIYSAKIKPLLIFPVSTILFCYCRLASVGSPDRENSSTDNTYFPASFLRWKECARFKDAVANLRKSTYRCYLYVDFYRFGE